MTVRTRTGESLLNWLFAALVAFVGGVILFVLLESEPADPIDPLADAPAQSEWRFYTACSEPVEGCR